MNIFVKKLLLWLLIAILPVQGMAAVLKASCGPRHHAVSVNVSVETDFPIEREHAHHKGHASAEMSPEIGLVQGEAVANEGSSTAPATTDHYASYCSACAACCTGATAPPASISAISATDNAEKVTVVLAVSYLGFIPPSLERPPKSFSA